MKWIKKGLVYVPDGSLPWARTHALVPTVLRLGAGRVRVYFASLDDESIGRIGFVEVAEEDPTVIVELGREPVMREGDPATFDECGVTPMAIIEHRGVLRMYYTGWQRGRAGRYTMLTGLAESEDGGVHFRRVRATPILERSEAELFTRTAFFPVRDGKAWRAWYVGGSDWIQDGDRERPSYDLRCTSSIDGTRWPEIGEVCLSPVGPHEFGFGRPCVWRQGADYRMIYSVRMRDIGYRLGYAQSIDGINWTRRDDEVGLDVGESPAWDSEMVCYGVRVELNSGVWLFYNGNQYGKSGFGVALLNDED